MNRGDHQTVGGTGGSGGGGAGGTGGQITMNDGSQDEVADSGIDAIDNCDLDGGVADAGDAGPPSSCAAMFNFESPAGCGLYGAFLNANLDNPPATDGFTNLRHTGVAYCGRGGMAVDLNFNTMTRTGGEIIIPISRTGIDLTGKVVSIAVKASAAGGPNISFSVIPVTSSRYEQKAMSLPLNTDWVTGTATLLSPDASTSNVIEISLQAHGAVDYQGTLYIDEVDIRNPTPDGGPSDAPGEASATDARDGGADVRDAPAGS